MRHQMEILIYKGDKIHRECFVLPSITKEEFNGSTHNKTLFSYPPVELREGATDSILVWTIAHYESEEERQALIDMGKIGFFKASDK